MRASVALCVLSLSLARVAAAAPRADIAVYADHVPTYTIAGPTVALTNPFDSRDAASDPTTRILLEAVPNLKHPLGTVGWGVAALGKYVLLGNYDEATGDLGQNIADQQIGLLDTERRTFCAIDLDCHVASPTCAAVNASVKFFAVAKPGSRQTRIYFNGYGSTPLGYIDADLGNLDPCNGSTGWRAKLFTIPTINAGAAALPVDHQPCPEDDCSFDGMRLLHYDATSGVGTLVLHSWFGRRVVVVTIDADGNLTVPDVYVMPLWQPDAGDGACFAMNPVAVPAVDPTRPSTDLRFTSGLDMICDSLNQSEGPPDGCAAGVPLCPGTGASCTLGSTCTQKVCRNGFDNCASNADCPFSGFCIGGANHGWLGCSVDSECPGGICNGCTDACLLVHPGATCAVTDTQHCARTSNCPVTGGRQEACICGPGRPLQEFSFDGTSITPTSALFQTFATHNNGTIGSYDSYGGLWVWDLVRNYDTPSAPLPQFQIYSPSAGEHAYSDPSQPPVVAPDYAFDFATRTTAFGFPASSFQVDNVMHVVGLSLRRALAGFGLWLQDDDYVVSLGSDVLPSEAKRCASGSNAGAACAASSSCPSSACSANETLAQWYAGDVALGGSPPTLVVNERFADTGAHHGNINAYLARVPVPVRVPDSLSTVRPGIVWTPASTCTTGKCDRLWMFAEHGGVLKFRIRDDGIWTGWYALPTNYTVTGGGSAIVNGTSIELFARANTGTVVTTTLTSTACSASACSWSAWSAVPGAPSISHEPAATMQPGVGPFIAVRRASDGRILYARRSGSTWSTWRLTSNTLVSSVAPALVWNPDDASGRMWVLATKSSNGKLYFGRISDLAFGNWVATPESGLEPWGTAPAAVLDPASAAYPAVVRIFAADVAFPNYVSQITWTAADEWDDWKVLQSRGQGTSQPAPALMNGDVDLVTYWYDQGMYDQLVK